MKIKNYLFKKIAESNRKRAKRFIEIGAPKIVIENLLQEAEKLETGGSVKIDGDKEALDLEFVSEEFLTGRGGKKYIQFMIGNGQKVNYFPNARYGRYIKFDTK